MSTGGRDRARGGARHLGLRHAGEGGVFPCDTANGSPIIDGDLLYVQTSNGIDRNSFSEPQKEKNRKLPAPDAPNVIVLDKRTGRLVATDDTRIADHLLHGQWSSLSMGRVGGRKLLFFGGGDGCCYAFEALASVPETAGSVEDGVVVRLHPAGIQGGREARTGSPTIAWATSGSRARSTKMTGRSSG